MSEEEAGSPLPLSRVFRKSEGWEEDRFGIADRAEVKGWGTTLANCGEGTSGNYYGAWFELRLTHRFTRMSMKVGQGNDSLSSNDLLVVEVTEGPEQVEIRRIPFDTVTPFDISVEGVNALTVKLYIDDEAGTCRSGDSIIAVVEDLTLT